MRVPDEKTKGFNILELIVVLLLVGIVSALGYPEITKWRKDREVKSFAIATKTLIEGIVCLLYTSPSPRDQSGSRMPSSA